jgi:hypothetical protein
VQHRLRLRGGAFPMAQVRAILVRADAHALDAARVGIEHFDLEIARPGDDFAAHRQAADLRHQIAAERIDIFTRFAGVEFLAHHGLNVLKAGTRIGDERAIRLLDHRRRFVAVMFVVDLADHLLDNVFDRDQSIGAAIFIDHKCQMNARGLHCASRSMAGIDGGT